MISLEIRPSSFLANIIEKIGVVLNNVQPIPIGSSLKTICCSNIPRFVPKNIEIKKFDLSFLSISPKKRRIFNFVSGIRKIIEPINLISVVSIGLNSLFTKTYLDKVAAETAQKMEINP